MADFIFRHRPHVFQSLFWTGCHKRQHLTRSSMHQGSQVSFKDHRAKALIAARIFRLANGLPGDVKPIGQGVSELRIHHGSGYRVYYQQRGNEMILLLCGGDKSSQQKDIETALQLAKEGCKS